MDKGEVKRLIEGYIANSLEDDDLAKLELVIKDERHWKDWKEAIESIDVDHYADSRLDSISKHTLRKRLDATIHDDRRIGSKSYSWLRIAASILLVSGLSWFSLQYLVGNPDKLEVAGRIQKSNVAGKKSTFYLPDGTRVRLNSESSLTYPASFDGFTTREIVLEGEAYFDVVTNNEQPFIVKAGKTSVKALGTAFNVDAVSQDVQVALTEGSVEVASEAKKIILSPGEMAIVEQNRFFKQEFNYDQVVGWTEGNLVFVDASLNEIVRELESWYGVDIDADALKNIKWKYNGEFKNKPLARVLQSIGYAKDFSYTIDSSNVTLKNNQMTN